MCSRPPQTASSSPDSPPARRPAAIWQPAVGATRSLPVDEARRIAGSALADAPDLTTGQFRARLRRLVIDSGPDAATERYRTGLEQRRVTLEANDDVPETAVVGAIERAAAILQEEGMDVSIFLTGGDASRILKSLGAKPLHRPHLVLQGLAQLLENL